MIFRVATNNRKSATFFSVQNRNFNSGNGQKVGFRFESLSFFDQSQTLCVKLWFATMGDLSETHARALNALANRYLRATYIFGFIVDVLEKDDLLQTITESCRLNRRIFADSFRV
jgi:hypothetical protein